MFSSSYVGFFDMKLLVFLIVQVVSHASCHKILGVFPFGAKSHYVIGEAVMRALHEAGHEVTMISVYELNEPMPMYNQIKIEDLNKRMKRGLLSSDFER